ncbi:MAG: phosphoribosylformylglycinamidine synthase subunit PurS [bacterium]
MAKSRKLRRKWRVEVFVKDGLVDAVGEGLKLDIEDLGIGGVKDVRAIQVYEIEGSIGRREAERIGAELLADAVSQGHRIGDRAPGASKKSWVVDVKYHPGVTDTVGASALKGIRDMRIKGVGSARTSMRYIVTGKVSEKNMDAVCRRLLANTVIQTYRMKKL